MKKTIFYLFLLLPLPALAHDYHSSYEQNNKCYGNVYREWEETIRIPCANHKIEINKNKLERNDYQKKIKDNFNSFIKWVNSKIADWKLNQSDNYLNK